MNGHFYAVGTNVCRRCGAVHPGARGRVVHCDGLLRLVPRVVVTSGKRLARDRAA